MFPSVTDTERKSRSLKQKGLARILLSFLFFFLPFNVVRYLMTGRVLCASLFLPYTVDFELSKDKRSRYVLLSPSASRRGSLMGSASIVPAPTSIPPTNDNTRPNLIDSLAAHTATANGNSNGPPPTTAAAMTEKEEQEERQQEKEKNLFDFKTPETLVQPKSKRERDLKKKLLCSTHSRQYSIDAATVFNEAPWTVKPCIAGNIGLQNAIRSLGNSNRVMWIGTLGMSTEALSQKTRETIRSTFIAQHDSYPVMPSDTEFEGHYDRYCKQVFIIKRSCMRVEQKVVNANNKRCYGRTFTMSCKTICRT